MRPLFIPLVGLFFSILLTLTQNLKGIEINPIFMYSLQNALLSGNTGTLIKFRLSTFFRTEFTWRKQIPLIMGQSDINKITGQLTGLNLAEDNRLEYQQVFTSPWCHSEEFEKEHKDMLEKVRNLFNITFRPLQFKKQPHWSQHCAPSFAYQPKMAKMVEKWPF